LVIQPKDLAELDGLMDGECYGAKVQGA